MIPSQRCRRLAALCLGLALVAKVARSQDDQAGSAGLRAYVSRPGLVRLALPKTGADVQLTTRGKPVPFLVSEAKDAILFWGEPDLESHDARGRCYHLRPRAEGEAVLRLDPAHPLAVKAHVAEASARGTVTLLPEEPRVFHQLEALDVASLAEGARPGGYWFYDARLTFECEAGTARLALDGVYVERPHQTPLPGGRVFEELGLHAKDKPGTVRLRVNGTALGPVALERQGASLEIEVPVTAGKNTIELGASRKGVVLVQHAALAVEEAVKPSRPFRAPSAMWLDPFHGLVVDLDAGQLLAIEHGDKVDTVTPDAGHRVLLLDPARALPAEKVEPCRVHEPLAPADWIAVAPRALLDSVKPLEAHRRAQGLTTRLLALEDLFDDATDGTFDPAAIARAAAVAKRYLLLVGDAWRDARPDDGPWLPTNLLDTYDNGGSASDYYFAPHSKVAIGRFPCRTPDEVAAMVHKTIAYETAPPAPCQKELAFVCGEGRFGPMVDGMIENIFNQAVSKRVPAGFDIDVTYANPQSVYFFPPDDFAKRVIERLSQGPLIFDYIGHGAPETLDSVHWGKKRFPILTAKDAEKVSCEEGHYPIALITACWTGAFDEADRTVGEVLALNPRGAVAVLAASRVSHPFANALLSLELTQNLFEKTDDRLGTRVKRTLDELSLDSGGAEGKLVVSFGGSMLEEENLAPRLVEDERRLYNLLGDPALVVRLPRQVSVVAPAEARAGESVTVTAGEGALASLSLERVRGPRTDIQGLDPGTEPEAMSDAKVEKHVRETYARANEYVLARGAVDGARGVLALPADLAPGRYVLKVRTAGGDVGSARLSVREASPPKKKFY